MLNEKFLKRMKEYLGSDYDEFIKSYDEENVRSFTVNTNYINNTNLEEIIDLNIKKIPYLDNGYYLLDENIKLGFHPLHHAGAFYMQDPSAITVVESIDIPSNWFALDLCAAPGGKSIQLANKLKNGVLISNEIDQTRVKALYSNIERMGFKNVVVTNNKPSDFLKAFQNSFDLILIDAPCSGEGMFRKYPNAIELWSLDNVNLCHNRDIEIVDIAHKLLKKDGILIYSTCTFAKEENEDIIKYLIDTYSYEQIDIKDPLKESLTEGFIPKTYRFYPHKAKGEGQFLAILKKTSGVISYPKTINKFSNVLEFNDFCKKNLTKIINNIIRKKDDLYYCATNYDLQSLKVLNHGVRLGEVFNKRFIPNHYFFKAFSNDFVNYIDLDYKSPLIIKYLHGEQINAETMNGFGIFKVNGIPLGGYKATNNNLNNYYPKGLRNF